MLSKKATEVETKAVIGHVDQHAGYAAAKAKCAQIGGMREKAERRVASLAAEIGEEREKMLQRAGGRILDGSSPSEAVSSVTVENLNQARTELHAIQRAHAQAGLAVEEQYRLAAQEVVAGTQADFAAIVREYFEHILALGKCAEAQARFIEERLYAAGVRCDAQGHFPGLVPIRFMGGSPTDPQAMINNVLRDGIARGVIRREELPRHWHVQRDMDPDLRRRTQEAGSGPHEAMRVVKFVRQAAGYNPGEVAGFPESRARELVEKFRVAVFAAA